MSNAKKTLISSAVIMLILTFQVMAGSLRISFTSQAPIGSWTQPWQDACEETSILIVDAFYNQTELTLAAANQRILDIIKLKEKYFGKSLDENAAKISTLINNFFYWESIVVQNPTLEQIKQEVNKQHPVILPTHGKALKNPYFLNGGADYHVLIISGYDDQTREFIAQDPGTRFGHNLRYSYETILEAMHDYVPGNKTKTGDKVIIFTNPEIQSSASLDGDKDGLTKGEEIKYKTNLSIADTDNDGYSDYEEVKNGYSPLINESAIKNGDLIRSAADKKIYLLQNGAKQHIVNPKIIEEQWGWEKVKTVSEKFLTNFQTGEQIK